MARHLRANTQVIVTIGPFVDKTDGLTPEVAIALSTADEAEILKHGSTSVVDISAATWAAITSCDGYYSLTLTTSHTDTEGQLVVIVQDDSECLPVRNEFCVLSEAAYDSLYAAKDDGFMDVNVKTVGRADTQETEADNLEAACAAYSATRGLAGTALPAAAADGAGGLPISDAGGLDLDALNTNVSAILSDTGTDGVVVAAASKTGYSLTATTGLGNQTANITGNLSGSVGSVTGHTPQTGDTYALANGANGFAAIVTDLDDVKGTGFAKDTHSLTNIEGYADLIDDGTSGLAKIATDVAAVLVDTADMQPKLGTPAGASMSADIAAVKTDTGNLVTRITSTLFTGITSLAEWLGLIAGKQTGDATARTELRATGAGSGTYDETTDSLEAVRDHVGDGTNLTEAGGTGDHLTALATAAALATVDTVVDSILVDTNELQTDWANGGRLDLIIDELTTQGDTNETAIGALNDLSAADVNAQVVDVMSTDTIADSYSTDGSQPTIAQAILEIRQFLMERAVASTTVTVKKPDGSTSAMTFTLDDATSPTSITRAT